MQTCTGCKIIFTCRAIGIEKVVFGRFREFRQFLTPKNDPKNGLFLTPENAKNDPKIRANFRPKNCDFLSLQNRPRVG